MSAVRATELVEVDDRKLDSVDHIRVVGYAIGRAVGIGENIFERELIQSLVSQILDTLLVHLSF